MAAYHVETGIKVYPRPDQTRSSTVDRAGQKHSFHGCDGQRAADGKQCEDRSSREWRAGVQATQGLVCHHRAPAVANDMDDSPALLQQWLDDLIEAFDDLV